MTHTITHQVVLPFNNVQYTDAAHVVQAFFAHYTQTTRHSDIDAGLHDHVATAAALSVAKALKLRVPLTGEPNDPNEYSRQELEFAFDHFGDGTYALSSPHRLTRDGNGPLGGLIVRLTVAVDGLCHCMGAYVLRVTPDLITFGGKVIWQRAI